MTTSRTLKSLLPAAALSLLLSAPALAAPAGDEYLPKVPEATGEQGAVSSSEGTTTDSSESGGIAASGKGGKGGGDDGGDNLGSTSSPLATSSDDDSSGGLFDTLLDPVVLLLIAGVIITAVGMTLRRRHEGEGEAGAKRPKRDPAAASPTPDGEIVTGGEKPSRP